MSAHGSVSLPQLRSEIGFDRVVRRQCGAVCAVCHACVGTASHTALCCCHAAAGFSRRDARGFVAKYGCSQCPQTVTIDASDAMHRHATAAALDATVNIRQTTRNGVETDHDAQ